MRGEKEIMYCLINYRRNWTRVRGGSVCLSWDSKKSNIKIDTTGVVPIDERGIEVHGTKYIGDVDLEANNGIIQAEKILDCLSPRQKEAFFYAYVQGMFEEGTGWEVIPMYTAIGKRMKADKTTVREYICSGWDNVNKKFTYTTPTKTGV